MSSEPFRSFRQLVIPREIWLHPELSLVDKAVWSEIFSLHCFEKGGCYAKDEYLMKFFDLGKTRVQEILKKLRDLQLLETVHNDGRERIMRAIPPAIHYGGDHLPGKPGTTSPENRGPPIPTPYNREEIDDKSVGASARPLPVFSSLKKQKRAPEVSTTDEEHERLNEKIGSEMRDEVYQALSEWKMDTPKSKWKKDDYRSILRWVIDAVKEKRLKKKESINLEWVAQNRIHVSTVLDKAGKHISPVLDQTASHVRHRLKDKNISFNEDPKEFEHKFLELFRIR